MTKPMIGVEMESASDWEVMHHAVEDALSHALEIRALTGTGGRPPCWFRSH